MPMSSISIFAAGSVVIAPLAAFLRHLLKQPLKVASTSDELLDLFEDRCALLEEHATLASPNDEGRASERLTVAAPNNLASRPDGSPPLGLFVKAGPVSEAKDFLLILGGVLERDIHHTKGRRTPCRSFSLERLSDRGRHVPAHPVFP
jgi:hypothetical protein